MAGGSLLALLDDISTILDDVSLMTKVAAKKTAGVLGDDLALNAEQVAGVQAERELPVVWAVAKGSFINKLILVPAALIISAVAPWLITPLLMIGGAYLCFEGFEKIAHKFLHSADEDAHDKQELLDAIHDPNVDAVAYEQAKIKGAIRTDFVLSAEIIVIALGTVSEMAFMTRAIVVSLIAVIMTVGVYGLVAGIVKMDDLGFHLLKDKASSVKQAIGRGLLSFAPWLMKALSVVGTIAMFLVGGGILLHGLHPIEAFLEHLSMMLSGGIHAIEIVISLVLEALFGIVAGGIVLVGVKIATPVINAVQGLFKRSA